MHSGRSGSLGYFQTNYTCENIYQNALHLPLLYEQKGFKFSLFD